MVVFVGYTTINQAVYHSQYQAPTSELLLTNIIRVQTFVDVVFFQYYCSSRTIKRIFDNPMRVS